MRDFLEQPPRDHGGQFDVAVQMDPKTAEEVKTMGCVREVSK
jgi:hypothetical protein